MLLAKKGNENRVVPVGTTGMGHDVSNFPLGAFEEALSKRSINLKFALNILFGSSVPTISRILKGHQVDHVPVWHSLARLRFEDEDRDALSQLLQYYVKCGYDINQTTDNYTAQKRKSLGFTALLAAIEQSNRVLLDVLLCHKVDVNIRDKGGFSPCHWAILVGDLESLKKLIKAGANVTSTKEEINGEDVHPILHTAVDEGRADIVYYLVEQKIVDIDEAATYKNMLTERSFTFYPSRYDCLNYPGDKQKKMETEDIECTPLARAVRMRKISIIEILLKLDAKLSNNLMELHFCIAEGDPEVACLLKEYFTEEELAQDKVNEIWALHCLHIKAFDTEDEVRIEKTKELIREYMDCGWDINSVSREFIGIAKRPLMWIDKQDYMTLRYCTLLHIACLHGSFPLVRFLVEAGAEVNIRTELNGTVCFNPLQISLLTQDWESAKFLIQHGADLKMKGNFFNESFSYVVGPERSGADFEPRSMDVFDLEPCIYPTRLGTSEEMYIFDSISLLLKMGDDRGEAVLDKMLKKVDIGAYEYHIAIWGGNPKFVSKTLKCVKDSISKDQLQWIDVTYCCCHQNLGIMKKVPAFHLFLHRTTLNPLVMNWENVKLAADIANLMRDIEELGYDFNITSSHGPFRCRMSQCLIFKLFEMDYAKRTKILLSTFLEFHHVLVNRDLPHSKSKSAVEAIIRFLNDRCLNDEENCWRRRCNPRYCFEVISLLLRKGADVSKLTIGADIKYHSGFKDILKLIFCAGATISREFFDDPLCHHGFVACRPFEAELVELKAWVEENKDKRNSLQFLCRMKLRSMISTVGDLEMLDELPTTVKDQVLCKYMTM